MKFLKITLFAVLLFGSLTACVNEELDDDMLIASDDLETDATGGGVDERDTEATTFTGGGVDERDTEATTFTGGGVDERD
ncbi:hypothetical protein FNB79_06505 [Formosa sediminum]|uniref:Uncharacterized protein n=1 Tax=Formosa sediminum TaxID=2594004 RepID=A0A516GQI8_9FLAO|nr:hypothetical protein [Formosa sediminum]QDO93640.1 hypothetical protein FNB79_06505 [Formosa sediminum]